MDIKAPESKLKWESKRIKTEDLNNMIVEFNEEGVKVGLHNYELQENSSND